MQNKKILIAILIVSILSFSIFSHFTRDSYSLEDSEVIENEKINLELLYSLELLEDNKIMFDYINLIDESLISNFSYSENFNLNDNYNFLTEFAIDFILRHEDDYKNFIIEGNDYEYIDEYGNKFYTNKYVDIDVLYDITDKVFGKKYYHITNNYLSMKDANLVPLLTLKDNDIFMDIEKIIDVNSFSNDVNVFVKYKGIDYLYKYVFEKIDNRLVIKDLFLEVKDE